MTTEDRPTRLLLGVSGGIAAYKAAELTSQAIKRGYEVRVVMTRAAAQFVGPITFEALTGHPVLLDALALSPSPGVGESPIEHIAWGKWAQIACIAPLTANTLAKLATGLADDALTTVWMALPPRVPNLLCPAMNTTMWEHPVVQRNVLWVEELGRYQWLWPVAKRLACGDTGPGGLAEVPDILTALDAARSRLQEPAA